MIKDTYFYANSLSLLGCEEEKKHFSSMIKKSFSSLILFPFPTLGKFAINPKSQTQRYP